MFGDPDARLASTTSLDQIIDGGEMEETYCTARKRLQLALKMTFIEAQKNSRAHPEPQSPSAPCYILEFHGLPRLAALAWKKFNTIDFWLPCLAGVETVNSAGNTVGWLAGDNDSVWSKALGRVALMLVG